MKMTEKLPAATMIITYCGGESFDLSHELAIFPNQMGSAKVWVLVKGWTLWQQVGLPVSVGP